MSTSHPLSRSVVILSLALLGSHAIAIVYVCVLTWTLPPSDGAYGQSPFHDPIANQVMLYGATVSAAVVGPFALALLWKTDLRRSVPVVFAVALATIALVAPRAHFRQAWIASVLATVLAMALSRWVFRLRAQPKDDASLSLVSPTQ
jgi:hypothetical protein